MNILPRRAVFSVLPKPESSSARPETPQRQGRARLLSVAVLAGALAAGFLLISQRSSNRAFVKHFSIAPPPGLRVQHYENSDWLGIDPEPVSFLRFSASPEELTKITAEAGFAFTTNGAPSPSGPAWWLRPESGAKLYHRANRQSGIQVFNLPVGKNRGWNEYLWIEGTNAWFLLWGI